jgi:hypothetical protein
VFYFDATLNLLWGCYSKPVVLYFDSTGNLGMPAVGLLGMLHAVGLLGMLPVMMFFTY